MVLLVFMMVLLTFDTLGFMKFDHRPFRHVLCLRLKLGSWIQKEKDLRRSCSVVEISTRQAVSRYYEKLRCIIMPRGVSIVVHNIISVIHKITGIYNDFIVLIKC